MKNLIAWVIFLKLAGYYSFAQCNEEMHQLAIAQVGQDIVLVRDFKILLPEGSKRNPSPSSRFTVLMQKGITYRFTISKDRSSESEPILQLFDKNELLGSTFNVQENKSYDKFNFLCNRTGNYQVIISMRDSKPGCAVGIMAMVTDSEFYAQGNKKPDDEKQKLYAGIKTPLNYITDQTDVGRIKITIDRGEIIEEDTQFYALVPNIGPAIITIQLFNKNDSILEDTQQEFDVIQLPEPQVKLEGANNEYITRHMLLNIPQLQVKPDIYRIIGFYLSSDLSSNNGFFSSDENLTYQMVEYISSLKSEQKFYIKHIRLLKPDGTEIIVGPLKYYLR